MTQLDNRIALEFYALCENKRFITCSELGDLCDVSERTIKNDLIKLKEYCLKSGCQLVIKKSRGVSIEIVNEDQFNIVKKKLDVQVSLVDMKKDITQSRMNIIAKILIIQKDYITLDEIADQLFVSRSTIKNSIKELRLYFEAFELELDSRPSAGVKILGDEFSKRLCMIELFEVHYPSKNNAYDDDKFERYFTLDEHVKKNIRNTFLTILRNSSHSMLDIQLNRLVTYLYLMVNRKSESFEIGSMYVNTLKSFDEYNLSELIINKISEITGDNFDQQEILAFELLLLIWNDVEYTKNMDKLYPVFFEEAQMITNMIFSMIKEEDLIDFAIINNSHNKMISCLITIMCKIFFKASNYIFTGRQIYENSIRNSPLSCYFAEKSRDLINEFYQCKLSDHDVNMLAVRFYSFIDQIDYQHKKRRILVVARNGYEGAYIIKNKILKRFNNRWFDKIDVCEYYEARRYNRSHYDYVVINYGDYSYNYEWPYIFMSQIPSEQEMEEFYNRVILSGFNLIELGKVSGINDKLVYDKFRYFSKDSFIQLLCYKLNLNNSDIVTLTRTLSKISDLQIFNEVLIIFIPNYYIKNNIFEIYHLDKKGVWFQKKVEYIIVVGINYQYDLTMCHFIERATSIITCNNNVLLEILESQDKEYFASLLLKNIKAG